MRSTDKRILLAGVGCGLPATGLFLPLLDRPYYFCLVNTIFMALYFLTLIAIFRHFIKVWAQPQCLIGHLLRDTTIYMQSFVQYVGKRFLFNYM